MDYYEWHIVQASLKSYAESCDYLGIYHYIYTDFSDIAAIIYCSNNKASLQHATQSELFMVCSIYFHIMIDYLMYVIIIM